MITEAQQKQVKYNDNLVANYKRNKAIQGSIKAREWDEMIKRRKEKPVKIEEDKIRLHNFYSTGISYNMSDLTEDMIEAEVLAGSEFNK